MVLRHTSARARFGVGMALLVVIGSSGFGAAAPARAAGQVAGADPTAGAAGAAAPRTPSADRAKKRKAPAASALSPASGPTGGGTTVVITGKNLAGVTSVTFGGTRAVSVTQVSRRAVRVVTPARAAGTAVVRVRTKAGGRSRAKGAPSFTFLAPAPVPPTTPTPPTTPGPPPTVPTTQPPSPTVGSVRGVVRDGAAAPVADVAAVLTAVDGSAAPVFAVSGPDGAWGLADLPAGQYDVCWEPSSGDVAAQCSAMPGGDPVVVTVSPGGTTAGVDTVLSRSGGVAGVVTGPGPSGGVPDVSVSARPVGSDTPSATATTDGAGRFLVEGLPPGDYELCFGVPTGGPALAGACRAGTVAVTAGAVAAGDMSLAARFVLRGTVTDPGAAPVPGIDVEVRSLTDLLQEPVLTRTAADGSYEISTLPADSYTVCFQAEPGSRLVSRCTGESQDSAVVLGPETPRVVLDTVLEPGASLAGKVTAETTGAPVADVGVVVFEAGLATHRTEYTRADGTYLVDGLAAGDYTLCFLPEASVGVLPECYRDSSASAPETAERISVRAGEARAGIDAQLGLAGVVTGTVRTASAPAAEVPVEAVSTTTGTTYFARTGVDGAYRVTGLPEDSYTVCFPAVPGTATVAAAGCHRTAGETRDATSVEVRAGRETTGVDATLADAAILRGRVREASGSGLSGVEVSVFPLADGPATSTTTDSAGAFEVRGLPTGPYSVCFYPEGDVLRPECWQDTPVDGSGGVTPVQLDPGAPSVLDVTLTPGQPTPRSTRGDTWSPLQETGDDEKGAQR